MAKRQSKRQPRKAPRKFKPGSTNRFKVLKKFMSGGNLGGLYHANGLPGDVIVFPRPQDVKIARYVDTGTLEPLASTSSSAAEPEDRPTVSTSDVRGLGGRAEV